MELHAVSVMSVVLVLNSGQRRLLHCLGIVKIGKGHVVRWD